ncbi:MAG: glycine--tRNA ligase subunit beta [Parvularculaceae bacterium]
MSELLLEFFSEEIPARMQNAAARALERAVNERLLDAGYLPEGVKAFAGPRRLTLVAAGLPARQPDRREEKKGPRVGAPAKAIEGFLKSAGLDDLSACETREDKKGAYYVAVVEREGRPTAALIAEFAVDVARGFSWPKSMRWGDGELRWVRPLRSVLCAYDGDVVDFEIDGLRSGDTTYGHRFMAPSPIAARSFEAYASALRAAKVELDGATRRETIAVEARTLCEAQGLALVDDPGLLDEVAGLAEWPVVMIGAFDKKFLALPDEALIASMRGHQKYFSVRDPTTGRLADRFVFVANVEPPDGGAAMRAGYERVLTARLSDAWFLYRQDLKMPLADRLGDLDRVTFFEGLGSMGDKARRVAALAREIAPRVGADPDAAAEAARLAKGDLVTGMVYEFPELQGVMGRYYAIEEGASDAVADAVRDHYKPLGQNDEPPTAPVSAAVALADKIDTLTAFWAVGKKPTGSGDPFALRRAALGVIATLTKAGVRLPLRSLIDRANALLKADADREADVDELLAFFGDRLGVFLREQGRRHDALAAVIRRSDGELEDDLVLLQTKLPALEAFLQTDDGGNLVAAHKRAANILKGADVNGAAVDPARFEAAEERALAEALDGAEADAGAAVVDERFDDAMAALAALRAPVDAFFAAVMVNADDAAVRANRLALLKRLTDATARVADLSKLEGDRSK